MAKSDTRLANVSDSLVLVIAEAINVRGFTAFYLGVKHGNGSCIVEKSRKLLIYRLECFACILKKIRDLVA